MIEGIQYPVTRYTFDIVASGGDLRIEMEPTQFDVPSALKIKTYGGNGAPETELKRYFHDFGFGMQGHRIDLDSGQAFPSDIYNVLVMSRGYLQDGKQDSILDFQVRGFIPPEGYADLVTSDDGDETEGDILESIDDWREELSVAMARDFIFESGKEPWDLKPGVIGRISKKVAGEINRLGFNTKPSAVVAPPKTTDYIRKRHGNQLSKKDEEYLKAAIENPAEILPNIEEEGKEYRGKSVLLVHKADRNYIAIVEISPEKNDNVLWNFWKLGIAGARNYLSKFRKRKAQLLQPGGATVVIPHIPHNTPEGAVGKPEGLSGSQVEQSSSSKSLDPDQDDVKNIFESAAIDREAHKAASSPKNNLPEPTEAQKESGNYRKGHLDIQGLNIAIENPAGSERSGVGQDGKKWTTKMKHHYGYIKGTKGRDKDHLDVFLGPDPEECNKVFIVNQVNPETGAFDEHKIMLGFDTEEEARAAYLSNYEKGWQGIGSICTLFKDEFKDWLKNGDTTIPVERGEVGSYRQDPSWIGVDLDGTLAQHDGDVGGDHIGEPIPLMMTFVKHLLQEGKRVKIFTARASAPEKIPAVKEWIEKHGLGDLEITNEKDQYMIKLYDDRAAKVIRNTGVVMESGYDWKSEIQAANSLEDIEDVFSRTFPTAVKERKPSVPTEIIDGEIVEAPWKLTFPEYEAYRINIGRHDEPTDLWAIYKDAMQSAIDAVKPIPPDVVDKYLESIRAEDAVSPLRYDPSTDRYGGRRLIRGDVVIDKAGDRYFIDRVNGYMLTLQKISTENKAVPGRIVSVSVDPSDRERYRCLFRAGNNIYSKIP